MDDERLSSLDPTLFFKGEGWFDDVDAVREGVRQKFLTFYSSEEAGGAHPYDLDRIATGIFYLRSLLQRHRLGGADSVAVEIGCGTGNKSFSICDLFGAYYGIDLQEDQIAKANARATQLGATNARFIYANATEAFSSPEKFGLPERVDVLLLYAVLEHLTLGEREDIIAIAGTVMERGGRVVVMESPNRLAPSDGHSSGINFLNNLPDDLANDYWILNGSRPEVAANLRRRGAPDLIEVLYRFGRGVSFHDFEVNLPRGLDHYGLVADSFAPEMLNLEPFSQQEHSLYGNLQANTPHVPAAGFSRCWLDFIMAGRAGAPDTRRRFVSAFWPRFFEIPEPVPFYAPLGKALAAGSADWDARVDFDRVIDVTLIFVSENSDGCFQFLVDGQCMDIIDCQALEAARPARWHRSFSVAFRLDRPVSTLSIRMQKGGILFQGCFVTLPAA